MVGLKPRRFTGYKSLPHRVRGNGTVMGEVIKFPRRTRAASRPQSWPAYPKDWTVSA